MQLDLEKSKRRMAHLLMLAESDPAEYSKAVGGATSVVVDFFPFVVESRIHDSVVVRDDGSFKAFVFAPDLSAVQAFRTSDSYLVGELVRRLVEPLKPSWARSARFGFEATTEFLGGRRQTLTFGFGYDSHTQGKISKMLDEVFPARHDLAKCAFPLRAEFVADAAARR